MASLRESTLTVAAAVLLAFAAGACGSAKARSAPTTSAAPTTPATSRPPRTVPRTTTTAWRATAPQLSPDAAAELLVGKWSVGDRAGARADASPAAVATLFSGTYPSGNLQFRGCTEDANPGTCTYRNTVTDGIYEITVIEAPSGWYVSSVTAES